MTGEFNKDLDTLRTTSCLKHRLREGRYSGTSCTNIYLLTLTCVNCDTISLNVPGSSGPLLCELCHDDLHPELPTYPSSTYSPVLTSNLRRKSSPCRQSSSDGLRTPSVSTSLTTSRGHNGVYRRFKPQNRRSRLTLVRVHSPRVSSPG